MIPSFKVVRFGSVAAAYATSPAKKVVSKDVLTKPRSLAAVDPQSLVLYKDGTCLVASSKAFFISVCAGRFV